MSNNIPFEIQMEVIERIPDIKWVIRCRLVSKAWKSVIDSKEFVTAHTLRHTHHQANCRLLIRTKARRDHKVEYMSIVDDDTFPHRKRRVFVPSESGNKFIDESTIVGTSHGLFCLYHKRTSIAVIWNPVIKKTVATVVPNVLPEPQYSTIVGFGVSPRNLDPKLVKYTYVSNLGRVEDVNTQVFTLSSGGTWRSPLSGNLPDKSILFGSHQAVVDGFIYWEACVWFNVNDEFRKHNVIMSFDLTSEEFAKVNIPDGLALKYDSYIRVSNLRESLAVLELKLNGRFHSKKSCDVWQMIGHGCSRSFNKLYSINVPDASICTELGFRKSGEPIIEVDNDKEDNHYNEHELAIYEPESKSITNIGIYGFDSFFSVYSYMETLLLLDH